MMLQAAPHIQLQPLPKVIVEDLRRNRKWGSTQSKLFLLTPETLNGNNSCLKCKIYENNKFSIHCAILNNPWCYWYELAFPVPCCNLPLDQIQDEIRSGQLNLQFYCVNELTFFYIWRNLISCCYNKVVNKERRQAPSLNFRNWHIFMRNEYFRQQLLIDLFYFKIDSRHFPLISKEMPGTLCSNHYSESQRILSAYTLWNVKLRQTNFSTYVPDTFFGNADQSLKLKKVWLNLSSLIPNNNSYLILDLV